MKKFLQKFALGFSFTLAAIFLPISAFAQTTQTTTNTGLAVNCNGSGTTTTTAGGSSVPPCDFNALIGTATHLIEWMFYVSVPIMVALLAYSGILYMTGVEKNISKAKGVFIKVAGGFAIMLVAYVVVYTVVGWITNKNFTTSAGGSASNPAVFLNN